MRRKKGGSAFISRILCSPDLAIRECGHLSEGSRDPAPACAGCDYYPESSIRRSGRASGPLFLLLCLAPHGVFRASFLAVGAVGSYPAFSPLPSFRFRSEDPSHPEGGLFSVTLSVAPAFAKDPRRLRAACCPVVSGLSSRPQTLRSRRATTPADPKA